MSLGRPMTVSTFQIQSGRFISFNISLNRGSERKTVAGISGLPGKSLLKFGNY
jgi:hypothetical protein